MNIAKSSRPAEADGSRPAVTSAGLAPDGSARRRSAAARLLLAGVILAAVAALAAGIWAVAPDQMGHAGPSEVSRPAVSVGYAVSGRGTARITYTQQDGTSHTVTAQLPWQQTTTLGGSSSRAAVAIVLGADGGQATCALTLHGKPVQHATAYGTYGRATCTVPPPAR